MQNYSCLMARINCVSVECGMRYHTPKLLFCTEFSTLFHVLTFKPQSTEVMIDCSQLQTALLWSTVKHANCKLHDFKSCGCKVPSFLILPICQGLIRILTLPFDLSWASWYLKQPFDLVLSQMLILTELLFNPIVLESDTNLKWPPYIQFNIVILLLARIIKPALPNTYPHQNSVHFFLAFDVHIV
jgi:hypothetical protein